MSPCPVLPLADTGDPAWPLLLWFNASRSPSLLVRRPRHVLVVAASRTVPPLTVEFARVSSPPMHHAQSHPSSPPLLTSSSVGSIGAPAPARSPHSLALSVSLLASWIAPSSPGSSCALPSLQWPPPRRRPPGPPCCCYRRGAPPPRHHHNRVRAFSAGVGCPLRRHATPTARSRLLLVPAIPPFLFPPRVARPCPQSPRR